MLNPLRIFSSPQIEVEWDDVVEAVVNNTAAATDVR